VGCDECHPFLKLRPNRQPQETGGQERKEADSRQGRCSEPTQRRDLPSTRTWQTVGTEGRQPRSPTSSPCPHDSRHFRLRLLPEPPSCGNSKRLCRSAADVRSRKMGLGTASSRRVLGDARALYFRRLTCCHQLGEPSGLVVFGPAVSRAGRHAPRNGELFWLLIFMLGI
jgi:hypothetical protein